MLLASATLLSFTGCANNTSNNQNQNEETVVTPSLKEIKSHVTKRVPLFSGFDGDPVTGFIINEFNGSTAGYFDIGEFFPLIAGGISFLQGSMNDYQFICTNTNTNSHLIIDFLNQTITIDNYDAFTCQENDYIPYQDALIENGKNLFVLAKTKSTYITNDTARVIDLSKYNIPLYYLNGRGYVPVDLLEILFCCGQINYFYNGDGFYLADIGTATSEQKAELYKNSTIYNSDYMEFNYNVFALKLDFFFGLDKKTNHQTNEVVTYLPNGAYEALKPYHDDMVSTKVNVSDAAFIKFFAEVLDDGGHTGYITSNVITDENATEITRGTMYNSNDDTRVKLESLREAKELSPSQIVKAQTGLDNEATQAYYEDGETAYVIFDSFTADYSTTVDYYKAEINETNYYTDTITLVKYANQKIREDNIKNVVIDVSLNGGGAAIAENFIASWCCNGITTKTRNTIDKTYSEQTNYADVNLDGVYNEEDYLPEDINLYCITSTVSFSCGNLLPTQLKDQSNCKFIGGRSGGGSCEVQPKLLTGTGSQYQFSKWIQLGRSSSTDYNNFESVEDGVVPEFYPISYEDGDIENFYNHDLITEKITQAK